MHKKTLDVTTDNTRRGDKTEGLSTGGTGIKETHSKNQSSIGGVEFVFGGQ